MNKAGLVFITGIVASITGIALFSKKAKAAPFPIPPEDVPPNEIPPVPGVAGISLISAQLVGTVMFVTYDVVGASIPGAYVLITDINGMGGSQYNIADTVGRHTIGISMVYQGVFREPQYIQFTFGQYRWAVYTLYNGEWTFDPSM